MEIRQSVAAALIVYAGVVAALGGWFLASQPREGAQAGAGIDVSGLELSVYSSDGAASSATVLDGPAHRKGEVVVLDFWASWCGPCHVQSRLLGDMVAEYTARGVHFFAVNVGESEDLVETSLKEHPIAFPVLMDSDGSSSSRAQVAGLPTLIIVDRDGSIALRRVGLTSARFLRDTLDELLAEPVSAAPALALGG